jgi:4-amino-4-deoxy-L-arabinose transferase-like glycosyltransferase
MDPNIGSGFAYGGGEFRRMHFWSINDNDRHAAQQHFASWQDGEWVDINMSIKQVITKPGIVLFAGLLMAIALAGAWMVKINTPFRMGMFPDSVTYIMGARNILAGNGFSQFSGTKGIELITVWPPLYSYVLATMGIAGMDAIRASRLLNIVLMGLDLLLFTGLVIHETRNKILTILAGFLFLFSVPLFERYTWALTEPLFFTLLLGTIIIYYLFLQTHKVGWLVVLGFGTALLYLTRYAGIFMSVVWLPTILLVSIPKRRMKNVILYLVGLLPLIIIHSIWNYLHVETVVNHSLYLQGMPDAKENFLAGLSDLEGWFNITGDGLASHTVSLIILSILVLAILAGLFLSGFKLYHRVSIAGEQSGKLAILFPLILTLPLYLAIVLLTAFFFETKIFIDSRLLSPLWLFGLYVLVLIADMIIKRGRTQQVAVIACLLAFLAFSIIKFQHISTVLRSDGQGYFSKGWRELVSLEYIRQTQHGVIYSDEPLAVYILTGKITYQVPFIIVDKNKTYLENYQEYDFMRARILESDGLLVLFQKKCTDLTNPWIQTITSDLYLIEYMSGTCFYAP